MRAIISNQLTQDRGPARIWLLDAIRGGAVAGMVVYHTLFDIKFFLDVDLLARWPDFWRIGSLVITSAFMLCVGTSLEVSGGKVGSFLRRQLRIGLGAVLVSIATYLFLPDWWIRFGVLHCIFFASFICWIFIGRAKVAAMVGGTILVAGHFFPAVLLPPRAAGPALDYVPLFPWAGVALVGMAAGVFFRNQGAMGCGGLLSWLGRHALAVYLLHQPVIVGLLVLGAWWWRGH